MRQKNQKFNDFLFLSFKKCKVSEEERGEINNEERKKEEKEKEERKDEETLRKDGDGSSIHIDSCSKSEACDEALIQLKQW